MQLIVGHTTQDSARIWVRGDWKNPCLRVELERQGPGEGPERIVRHVWVNPWRDYTAVLDLRGRTHKGPLAPGTPYEVQLRSLTGGAKVVGRLRTFPKEGSAASFSFLHGSCNLSTMRLTAIGSMAAAFAGAAATNKALELPREDWDTRLISRWLRFLTWPGVHEVSRLVVKGMNMFVLYFTRQTRFEHGKPKDSTLTAKLKALPSPFAQILAQVVPRKDDERPPAFMIHCGDQIYFDVDYPSRTEIDKTDYRSDYRHNYRQAWFNDESAHELLRSFPNYMVLDDHEVLDGYGNAVSDEVKRLEDSALAVYDEYVSARQPDSPGRYYSFEYGDAGFFVLDTRSERWREIGLAAMIDEPQMEALETWLRSSAHAVKFIITSVPFVAQLRPAGLDARGARRSDEQSDKWSGAPWEAQRERIISAIFESKVERLLFLTGDMHCTYHATMKIGLPHDRVTIHELAGGPINQLLFAKRDDFYARYSGEFANPRSNLGERNRPEELRKSLEARLPGKRPRNLPWTSTLEAFHGSAPAILRVSISRRPDDASPVVEWEALRTTKFSKPERDPHALCGRIHFPRGPMAQESP